MILARSESAALKALVALLADEFVRAAMTPQHLELARVAGWAGPPRTGTFRVGLAEKPRDLLVYLVDRGRATTREIAESLGVEGGLYSGGLNVLRDLGLAEVHPLGEPDQSWRATDEGRRLVADARGREEARDAG